VPPATRGLLQLWAGGPEDGRRHGGATVLPFENPYQEAFRSNDRSPVILEFQITGSGQDRDHAVP